MVHRVIKSRTWLKDLACTHTHTHTHPILTSCLPYPPSPNQTSQKILDIFSPQINPWDAPFPPCIAISKCYILPSSWAATTSHHLRQPLTSSMIFHLLLSWISLLLRHDSADYETRITPLKLWTNGFSCTLQAQHLWFGKQSKNTYLYLFTLAVLYPEMEQMQLFVYIVFGWQDLEMHYTC